MTGKAFHPTDEIMSTEPRQDRLVLSYLGEKIFHRVLPGDESRPACDASRIRGVPMMRIKAERIGLTRCPRCWPADPGEG